MRNIIIIFLTLLMILSPGIGDEGNNILLVGDYKLPPFEYLDEKGNPRGFSVDIVKELSREIGKTITVKLMPWDEAMNTLKEGKAHGIELMRITEERKKEFDFIPYIETHSVIVVLEDSSIQNFVDLKGKKIACFSRDVAQSFLLEIGEVIPEISSEEVLASVLNGNVEAGVVNYYAARWIITKNEWQDELKILPDKLFTNYSGIALPKGSPLLLEFQAGISKVMAKPVYNDLLKKWFGEEIILKQELKKGEETSRILVYIFSLTLLVLLSFLISRRFLKREVYRQTLEIRNLLDENKKKYNELTQVYNFLRETTSKNIEEIEEIYFEKLKELFPNCKIKYFKKIDGKYLLSKSYPEEPEYTIDLKKLDEMEGEKYLFKDSDNVLSFVVVEGKELEESKEAFNILSEELEHLFLNMESQEKLRKSQEVSSLLDTFSSSTYKESIVLENFLKRIIQILHADVSSIVCYLEEEGLLLIKASVGLSEDNLKNTILKLDKEILDRMIKHRKPLILENKFNVKSAICYPLIYENKFIGILNINSFNEYRRFNEEDILVVEKIAPLLASVLYREELEERIETLNKEALFILVEAIEARDPYVGGHSRVVRDLSLKLGEEIGLEEKDLKILEYASYLHDVGKIKVPDFILRKPEKLNEEEFGIIRMHSIWGEEIVKNFSVFKGIGKIIRNHHERWDGNGYPDGLAGESIPLFSRIITLADSFQAMTSFRPYKRKLSLEEAIEEVKRCKGTQFDPNLSEIFIEIATCKKII
ncbi:MAG TPA: transporter substrate-binding domain-containing protein [Dictyoglomaceae bacterium]|nr:transporter substrate-binding domain-containing protein [Dictyoglomaceae bacterium]